MAESRRRAYGEGAIYQLADGRWQGSVELGWSAGTRRRKRITRRRKSDVARELRALVTAAEAGQLHPDRSPTLEAWLDTYLREVAAARVRPVTLDGYQNLIRLHVTPELGRHRLDQLRPHHVAALYRRLGPTLAPSSVRRVHAVLRRALTVAVRWGLITTNPALMVDAPSMTRTEIVPYTVGEARKLLDAASGDRLEARWLIALTLGLRQGEVLGLGWQHVDTERRLLTVDRALQKQPDGALALIPTKTQRSNRRLPMTTSVAAALERRRELQLVEQQTAGPMWHNTDLVFTTAIGTPIHPRNDYRAFRHLITKAGLRHVRLHDLRHTAASLLLAEGVAARVVMEILGHSQISITLNTYTHVDPELNRDAAERLERLLQEGTQANGSTLQDVANLEGATKEESGF
jgi:integrase